jgi:hypothetical protein
MRTFAVFCTLTLLATPYFFAYLETERLLRWPDALSGWFEPWLPIAAVLATALLPITIPWIVGLFGEEDPRL